MARRNSLATPCTTSGALVVAGHQFGAGAGAFLRRQPGQVDRLHGADVAFLRVEAAGQQDLVDQLVELGDVAPDLVLERGRGLRLHQLQPHADARQRRAQLVRRIGQQRLVRLEQRLHAFGRVVEALGEEGQLVRARLLDARRQVALAPALHALAQVVQPLREAADDGVACRSPRPAPRCPGSTGSRRGRGPTRAATAPRPGCAAAAETARPRCCRRSSAPGTRCPAADRGWAASGPGRARPRLRCG